MDDQHDNATDHAERLCLALLKLDEAGRQEVYALIRELAAESDKLERATTVDDLFHLWRDVRRRAEAVSDDAIIISLVQQAFLIEHRAVGLPLTSARDVLALIVMTTDASNELARRTQDALVARAYAKMDAS